jgi:hypothetical protein
VPLQCEAARLQPDTCQDLRSPLLRYRFVNLAGVKELQMSAVKAKLGARDTRTLNQFHIEKGVKLEMYDEVSLGGLCLTAWAWQMAAAPLMQNWLYGSVKL